MMKIKIFSANNFSNKLKNLCVSAVNFFLSNTDVILDIIDKQQNTIFL